MSVSTSLYSHDLPTFLFSLPVMPVALAVKEPCIGTDLCTSTGGLSSIVRHLTSWESLSLDRKRRKRKVSPDQADQVLQCLRVFWGFVLFLELISLFPKKQEGFLAQELTKLVFKR